MARLVRLAILILDAILVKDLVGVRTTAIGHVRRTTLGVGKQLEALVDLGGILLEVEALCLLLVIDVRVEATAQHKHIAELVDVLQADLQCLYATH